MLLYSFTEVLLSLKPLICERDYLNHSLTLITYIY